MATRLLNILLRCALLAAIVSSAVLFVDYQTPGTGGFCAEAGSGCAEVKASPFSHIGPVGLPSVGLGTFLGIYATSLWASRRRQLRILAVSCSLAALGALGLIALQIFWVKALCQWCMAADGAALVAAGAAIALMRRPSEPVEPRGLRALWAGVGVFCVALPMLWETPPAPADVPAAVVEHYAPGRVDIVMFTDFECPFCRRLHTVVDEVARAHPERIHVTRVMVPLKSHPGAEPAALAYLCTPEAARDPMADALYGASPGELTPKGVTTFAERQGIAPEPFARCLADETTRVELEAHKEAFSTAGLRGVPSTFVEQEVIEGARDDALLAAVDRALEGHSAEGGAGVEYMVALLLIVVLGAAGASLYVGRSEEAI